MAEDKPTNTDWLYICKDGYSRLHQWMDRVSAKPVMGWFLLLIFAGSYAYWLWEWRWQGHAPYSGTAIAFLGAGRLWMA